MDIHYSGWLQKWVDLLDAPNMYGSSVHANNPLPLYTLYVALMYGWIACLQTLRTEYCYDYYYNYFGEAENKLE